MEIFKELEGLIQKAIEAELIEDADKIYVRNQILHLLKIQSYPEQIEAYKTDTIPNYLEKLIDYAIKHHVIDDVFDEKEMLAAKIMNCFIPHPSIVNKTFYEKYKKSPKQATDYFYQLSKNSNYIQMKRIARNVTFKTDTKYGKLHITINLSKPEKDPEQIRQEKEWKQKVNYPKCVLCRENEGYVGRTGHPARANHRVIKVPLLGENWYLQYSPYLYYNEHSIIFSEEHREMRIDRKTFERLLTFAEKFPHYFIGSNADLPIVGGSILSHDHYQAGYYDFPMTNAKDSFQFELKRYKNICTSVLNWPMSVIRLRSKNKHELVEAANDIYNVWKQYDDEEVAIRAFTNETPHNTVTPIARIRNDHFEMDIVLRNNRTTSQYPLGLFHPHEDVHHIKKENIGLIEVMGLAVLPSRLKNELQEIRDYLLARTEHVKDYHKEWAEQLKLKYGILQNNEQAETILQRELGIKFTKILEDAGVFKQTEIGMAAFKRFINTLNA